MRSGGTLVKSSMLSPLGGTRSRPPPTRLFARPPARASSWHSSHGIVPPPCPGKQATRRLLELQSPAGQAADEDKEGEAAPEETKAEERGDEIGKPWLLLCLPTLDCLHTLWQNPLCRQDPKEIDAVRVKGRARGHPQHEHLHRRRAVVALVMVAAGLTLW